MIYTITFNPALDYIVSVPQYTEGAVNRSSAEKILAGGKGINVSTVLHNLGIESVALGFAAGFTGEVLTELLDEMQVKTDFIRLSEGFTRINVKIKAAQETEINGIGPAIGADAIRELHQKLAGLQDGDVLVLAGSISHGLPDDIYCNILESLADKRLRVVVDATRQLLIDTLRFRPFLIKPNNFELSELVGRELSSETELAAGARELQTMGARNVLVSRGGAGALLVTDNGEVITADAPQGRVVNTTGAGDSMVAGFLAGYLEDGSYQTALKMGLAAGSASAFSENLATRNEIIKLYHTIQ